MARKRFLRLQWPLAGLDRKLAYQNQPPFSTVDALNVRPRAIAEDRSRGGSRPGLLAWPNMGSLTTGSGPIRGFGHVRYINPSGLTEFSDDFIVSTLAAVWSAQSDWYNQLPEIVSPTAPNYAGATGSLLQAAAVLDALPMDRTQPYICIVDFLVGGLPDANVRFEVVVGMDDVSPLKQTDSTVITLYWQSGVTWVWDRITTSPALPGGPDLASGTVNASVGIITLKISVDPPSGGYSKLTTWLNSVMMENQVSIPEQPGSRSGFGFTRQSSAARNALADKFRMRYTANKPSDRATEHVVVVRGGLLYAQSDIDGDLALVLQGNRAESTDRPIHTQERDQELFIADYGPIKAKGDSTTTTISLSGSDYHLVDTDVADFTILNIQPEDGVYVQDPAMPTLGLAQHRFLTISSVTANYLVLDIPSSPISGLPVNWDYTVTPLPKKYVPLAGIGQQALHWMTDLYSGHPIWPDGSPKGIVPYGCPCIALHRGRIFLAGYPPHIWYASRVDDPHDFNYGDDPSDPARAIAGENSEAGLLGEPITALMTSSDDFLVFGCLRSLWVLRGDPGAGGVFDNISHVAGPVDKGAWCHGPQGEILFLSHDGLYLLAPGAGAFPQAISRPRLPSDLRDVDRSQITVTMAYDPRDRGVHIFLAGTDAAAGQEHWWFDWDTRSFWPVQLPNDQEPTALLSYAPDSPVDPAIILGCRDGAMRYFDRSAILDDGQAIASHCLIGPIRVGAAGGLTEGIVTELVATLGLDSVGVNWTLYAGNTPEEAYKNPIRSATGQFSAGLGHHQHCRLRGNTVFLKIENGSTAGAWELEQIAAGITASGRLRLA